MCEDKPWTQADRKTVSMLYLSLGSEGRRIICSRNPHLKMDILTTVKFSRIMEITFIRQRNITFDRYMLLTTKQSKGESIGHFFGKIKELSENCDLENQEDTLIRQLFIANLQDSEIQRELLRGTLEPAQTLRLATNMELGQRNQLKISNAQPASHVNAITPQRPFRQSTQRQNVTARINYAETVASLGLQITRTIVLQKARHAIIAVYRIIFRVNVVNRSLHLLNQLVPVSTQLRKLQPNSLLM